MTPINPDVLQQFLNSSGYDAQKTNYLVNGFRHGFDIGYHGPMFRKHTSDNIPFKIGNATVMWNKLMDEVKERRIAGPFEHIPFENFIQSLIGLVPKAGNKTWLIFHLSFDFDDRAMNADSDIHRSFNYFTDDSLATVKYRDLDHAVRNCIKLRESSENAEQESVALAKTDLKNAFHLVPACPEQRKFLIIKAAHPRTQKFFYFVDKCLPFGARASCHIFQTFSDALHHIIENSMGRVFHVTNYLDDFLFVDTTLEKCNTLVR